MTDETSKPRASKLPERVTFDYRKNGELPKDIRELIETHLAIESEDARSSGSLGFMSRALVLATMPYKDPKTADFTRVNGDFKLRILAGYDGGIPFGIYPRLLMSWVTTEAVRTQSPELHLGDSLTRFLNEVMGVQAGGGPRGSATRVTEQMKRLFGALITAQYNGTAKQRGFTLRNVLIAEEFNLSDEDMRTLDGKPRLETSQGVHASDASQEDALWDPQVPSVVGQWQSKLRLTNSFYRECVDGPVPLDMRAYKALRDSAMAMDIYAWLTYRMSYTYKVSRPIRWEALQMQFGAGFPLDSAQGRRDFKKAFLRNLAKVLILYPEAKLSVADERGLILMPSRPHIAQVSKDPQSKSRIFIPGDIDGQKKLF